MLLEAIQGMGIKVDTRMSAVEDKFESLSALITNAQSMADQAMQKVADIAFKVENLDMASADAHISGRNLSTTTSPHISMKLWGSSPDPLLTIGGGYQTLGEEVVVDRFRLRKAVRIARRFGRPVAPTGISVANSSSPASGRTATLKPSLRRRATHSKTQSTHGHGRRLLRQQT